MKTGRAFRSILLVLAILVIGTMLGLGSLAAGMAMVGTGGNIRNGEWTTNLATGSQNADPYLRAVVAVFGLLALNPSEAMYYTGSKDSSGAPLNANCTYRIEGKSPDARWWSITVYGGDGYPIRNMPRYSYSMSELTPDSNGVYTLYLSKTPHPGYWISLGNESTFELSLRLYNPGQSVRNNPGAVELLRVIKEDCK